MTQPRREYGRALATFGTPVKPGYWKALDEVGHGQVALLLPTLPKNEPLRLLDDYAAAVAKYRG